MNKITKVIFVVLGGIEATFSIAIPIMLSTLMIEVSGIGGWNATIVMIAGLVSGFFRAIRVGWMK